MKITRAARTILSVTALAWAIPFAQAEDKEEPLPSQAEIRNIRGYAGRGANDSAITGKVKAASTVAGVAGVKDSLAVRN